MLVFNLGIGRHQQDALLVESIEVAAFSEAEASEE
jgi:hypothetical protein